MAINITNNIARCKGSVSTIMTIEAIKSFLSVPELPFQNVLSEEGQPTEWYSCWIKSSRTKLLIHQDTIPEAKTSDKLSLKDNGIKVAHDSGLEYRTYIIVQYKDENIVRL